MTRTLIVIRHAQAGPHTGADHERALTERGRDQATAIGRFLSALPGPHGDAPGFVPDAAVVSSATRTRQTWDELVHAAGFDLAPRIADELYLAGFDDVVRVLRELPAEVMSAVVVGHNPTMSDVAHRLDDGLASAGVRSRARGDFPTGSTAVFRVEDPWAELEPSSGHLVDFLAP